MPTPSTSPAHSPVAALEEAGPSAPAEARSTPAATPFQQVGGDAPPAKDPHVVDPPNQDPPVEDPLAQDPSIRDPLIHVDEFPDEIDEVMAGRVVWRLLQRAVGLHLEAPRTMISKIAPNLDKFWLDHTDRVLDDLDYPTDQRLRAYTALLKDQAYSWREMVQRNTSTDQLTSEVF
ncbi:hypothetical protein V6N13_110464 [Hibiscus sabdariffa]